MHMNTQLKLAAAYLAPARSSLESAVAEIPQWSDYHLDSGVSQKNEQWLIFQADRSRGFDSMQAPVSPTQRTNYSSLPIHYYPQCPRQCGNPPLPSTRLTALHSARISSHFWSTHIHDFKTPKTLRFHKRTDSIELRLASTTFSENPSVRQASHQQQQQQTGQQHSRSQTNIYTLACSGRQPVFFFAVWYGVWKTPESPAKEARASQQGHHLGNPGQPPRRPMTHQLNKWRNSHAWSITLYFYRRNIKPRTATK
jgi:hypothetical protein